MMRTTRAAAACFLDFDHTLFNTDEFFHVDLRNCFLRLGIDAVSWEQSYALVWPSGYTLEKHAEEIGRRSGHPVPPGELERLLLGVFSDLRRYLFPDVLPFLEGGKRMGVAFYLLSFGNPEWQRYKVLGSRIGEYFEAMFFTAKEGGKGPLVLDEARGFDRIVMVDNNPAELDSTRDLEPAVRTYWMNRVPEEMLDPRDESSRFRFLEARRYVGMAWRHQHIGCGALADVVLR